MSPALLGAALLALLLAGCDSGKDENGPPDGDADSDVDADADTDTGASPAPVVEIRAPPPAATLFLGTRYDLVAWVTGARSATATVTGAGAACNPLSAGVLHCSLLADAEGSVRVEVAATGPGGEVSAVVEATAREAVGVVPAGDRFAMGMYELMEEDWFAPVAAAGFELAQSYGTGGYTQDQWQDWASAAGMLTMTRTSWSWSDPWDEPSSDDVLTDLATRREIAWWELPDNAVEDDAYADEVAALVDRIRTFDDRPMYMYLWTSITPVQIEAYLPYLDVVAPGTYPEHACQPQPWIRWRMESALQAVVDAGYTVAERPVVGTADLYAIPDPGCVAAEWEQVRMNPIAMIAAGARGVLYFAWYYAVYSLDPSWGESAQETAGLITGESGLGLAVVHGDPLGDCPVTVSSGPEMSEAFTPHHATEVVQYPSLHAASWDYAGTRFVVAVNYTDQEVTARIGCFPGVTPGAEVVGESRTLTPSAGVVEDTFGRWGAHVYRAPVVEP